MPEPAPPTRSAHERSTPQKRALASALDDADGFRSAQELFAELRDAGHNVGLTTVYSQLRSLADAGALDTLRAGDGETLYRRCATAHHHHHLVCRRCGTSVELDAPDVEAWAARIGAAHRFTDLEHTVEIVGTCPACAG